MGPIWRTRQIIKFDSFHVFNEFGLSMSTLLDLELLRTLVIARDLGNFAEAARVVGRTQSAVSLQMRKLEAQLGTQIFRKNGRKLDLNPAGERLLEYSRRLLALNEEALEATAAFDLRGSIRVGLLQDFAETVLPGILSTFANAHPLVETEIVVERSPQLIGRLARKELDLVLLFEPRNASTEFIRTKIASLPMYWVFRPGYKVPNTLSLIFLQPPCVFRDAALKNLGSRQVWRQTLSTPSLSGIWAAVEAGLGMSVRTKLGLPQDLTTVRRLRGRANLPLVEVTLLEREQGRPIAARFRESLLIKLAAHFKHFSNEH
jgi:DNA-binding transcriptional LysR family regulator